MTGFIMALTKNNFTSVVTKTKVNVNIDMTKELDGLTPSQQTELKNIVGNAFIDAVRNETQKQKSPVTGNKFDPLSPEYKAKKIAEGKGGKANLFLDGLMMGDLHHTNQSQSINLKITDGLSKKKMFNHNSGDTVPKRQSLPDKNGQSFSSPVMRKINGIIRNFKKDI